MNYSNIERQLHELDIRKVCIYLMIVSSILYLITYNKNKSEIIDGVYGTHYSKLYPDTSYYPELLGAIFLVINTIFFFYSNKRAKEHPTFGSYPNNMANPYYVNNIVNIIQLTATLIAVYNVVVNNSGKITITR